LRDFANLLDQLLLTPSRNRKLQAINRYLRSTPDPDRGLGLAAITGDLKIPAIKPSLLRELICSKTDEQLFALSYDYVGDLAETISLLWEAPESDTTEPGVHKLSDIVSTLKNTSRTRAPQLLAELFDQLPAEQRYALIKLATGGLRVGVSARLAKQALATFGDVAIEEIEEMWHGLKPPYTELFAWLEGRADKPVSAALASFRPVMLSHALEPRDHNGINPDEFIAEWKWDGIRVQLARQQDTVRLYSRSGDDISNAFPDIVAAMNIDGTFDGELLVRSPMDQPFEIRSFSDLQQRLNRKRVSKQMLDSHPAFLRLYDVLFLDGQDLREQPLQLRRPLLESCVADHMHPERFDCSEMLPFDDFDQLSAMRTDPPHPYIEGLMLKRQDSIYRSGRPRGYWFKWKRDPLNIDAVLMYAQHGHGKRSGYYSDFTFGLWRSADNGNTELVPVGKAYFGFTDDELKQLDKFVRNNTVERFGPVRSVVANHDTGLVLEIAFDGVNRSKRHKSGVALRFPRISRIRWDKPAIEADQLPLLEAMIGD